MFAQILFNMSVHIIISMARVHPTPAFQSLCEIFTFSISFDFDHCVQFVDIMKKDLTDVSQNSKLFILCLYVPCLAYIWIARLVI